MEYKDYMNQIQQRLNTMSEEEKNQWIYQYARVLDKSQRQKMLESLNFEHSQIINFHEKDFQHFISHTELNQLLVCSNKRLMQAQTFNLLWKHFTRTRTEVRYFVQYKSVNHSFFNYVVWLQT